MWLGPGWGPEAPVGAPCSVVAWLVSRKPGVPSGLSEPHGLLLLPVLIFFSLNTLSGRGRSTQGVKAWMPPLVSWLEFPVRVMETGLEEGWSIWVTSGVAWTRGGLGEQPPAGLFRGSLGSRGPSGKGWPGDRCLGFTEGWACVPTCPELSHWGQVWEPVLEGRRGGLGSLHVAGPRGAGLAAKSTTPAARGAPVQTHPLFQNPKEAVLACPLRPPAHPASPPALVSTAPAHSLGITDILPASAIL